MAAKRSPNSTQKYLQVSDVQNTAKPIASYGQSKTQIKTELETCHQGRRLWPRAKSVH